MIYLDNCASTELDTEAREKMIEWLAKAGNPHAGHCHGREAREAMAVARGQVMSVIGASADEWDCVFTSGATESNNMILKGRFFAQSKDNKKFVLITSKFEHSSVTNVINWLHSTFPDRLEIHRLPSLPDGSLDIPATESLLRSLPVVDLVSCIHAIAETGTVQPIRELSTLVREIHPDAVLHTDASQTVGKIRTDDLHEWVDAVTVAGHKFHGPKGTGALLLRRVIRVEPIIHGAGQEGGMRGGTENVAGIVGLGIACKNSTSLMTSECIDRLWDEIKQRLGAAGIDVRRNSVGGIQLPNCLNLSIPGVNTIKMVSDLGNSADRERVCFSAGSACHSRGEPSPSGVLVNMGLDEKYAFSGVRLSTSKRTIIDEVIRATALICDYVESVPDRQ